MKTLARWAWNGAAALSLLLCAGACLLLALSATGRTIRLPAVAVAGRYVGLSSAPDGLALLTIADWPGGADVYWPGSARGELVFKLDERHNWRRLGMEGSAAVVRVPLGLDGRPLLSRPDEEAMTWNAGTPSAPMRQVQVYGVSHWWAVGVFVIAPAWWLHLRRRRRAEPGTPDGTGG